MRAHHFSCRTDVHLHIDDLFISQQREWGDVRLVATIVVLPSKLEDMVGKAEEIKEMHEWVKRTWIPMEFGCSSLSSVVDVWRAPSRPMPIFFSLT